MVDRVPPYCRVCNGVEGTSLPTDCPGTPLTKAQVGAIYRGDMDFRGGEWVDLRPSPLAPPPAPEPPGPPPSNTVHQTVEVELPQPDPPPAGTTTDPVIIPVPVPVPVPLPLPSQNTGTDNPQVIIGNTNVDPNLDVSVTTK